MNRISLVLALLGGAAATALAQPTITSLGGGVGLGVTNNLAGTIYVGGSGLSTTSATRWSLTGGVLTATEIGGSGGGYISANGAYQTGLQLNAIGPNQVFGYTAAAVAPAHRTDPTLIMSATLPPATDFCGHRWTASYGSRQLLARCSALVR